MKHRGLKKALVGIVAACALAFGMFAIAMGGTIQPTYTWYTDDPSADTFTLSNPADLAGFSNLVNGTAEGSGVEGAVSFEGKTVQLSADGNFSNFGGSYVTPIGTSEHPFAGTFDGNGKVIDNFKVETEVTEGSGSSATTTYRYENLGLFGYVTGSIQNTKIGKSASITIHIGDESFVEAREALGEAREALRKAQETFEKAKTSGDQETIAKAQQALDDAQQACDTAQVAYDGFVQFRQAVSNIGLLVGYCEGSLTNCTNYGSVSVSHEMNSSKEIIFPIRNVGGLGGQVLGDITGCINGDITEYEKGGTVTVSETGVPYAPTKEEIDSGERIETSVLVANIGGIVGCAGGMDSSMDEDTGAEKADIVECSNVGTVTVDVPKTNGVDRFGNTVFSQASSVGGIAGYARGDVASCTNSGTLNAAHARELGGIIGSLRGCFESGNFASDGADDGLASGAPAITLSLCQNTGNMVGYAFVGGIVGRAGTYTTITESLNGTGVTNDGPLILGVRSTKPFVGGIAGSIYGTVKYCANFGDMGSAVSTEPINLDKGTYTVGGGYYVSGLVGIVQYYTDENKVRTHDMPEVYASFNAGTVKASSDKMRQRALVGDNEGFVHDCVSTDNCGTMELYFTESSLGTVANCYMVPDASLKTNAAFTIDGVTSTPLSVININGDAEDWETYWTICKDTSTPKTNNGYFALNSQVTWETADITTAQVSLAANAEYSGLASIPKASVTLDGTMLAQGIDFKVVPQPASETDCIEVTEEGATPYAAKIVGLGSYSGEASTLLSYGMDKGNLANCSVLIGQKHFNWEGQVPDDVTVISPAGATVDASEYAFAIDANDANLTDGEAVNAKSYKVIVTASESSTHFYGSNDSGTFSITPVRILWNPDNPDDATVVTISYNGVEYPWESTSNSDITDSNRLKLQYTGKPIRPEVTKVTYLGRELTQGVDYSVVYGSGSTMSDPSDDPTGNVNPPYGWIIVRFIWGSNFSNYDLMKFEIVQDGGKNDIAEATIKGDKDIIFEEGSVYEPITVWFGGSKLTEDTDYTITYQDNDKLGEARYTITGIGDLFTGTKTGTFTIKSGTVYELQYAFDEEAKTATVTGVEYYGANATFPLDIPATVTVDGTTYDVTSIAEKAFGGNSMLDFAGSLANESKMKIDSVVIPASVTTIGDFAFGSASDEVSLDQLTSVTFEGKSQLQMIGNSAFRKTGITSIEIPSKVESIGPLAFAYTSLQTVTFLSGSADIPSIVMTPGIRDSFRNVKNVAASGYDEATAAQKYVAGRAKDGWTWTSLGPAEGLPIKTDGTPYHIVSKADSRFVLDVAYATPVEGSNVSIWTDNGGANQLFTFELGGNGGIVLRNVANDGLVLDAAGAQPKAGANISTWTYNGGLNQQWILVPSDKASGYYSIASASDSTFVLDAAGAEPEIGANVGLWNGNGGPNQLWAFVPANDLGGATVTATGMARNIIPGKDLSPKISIDLNGRTLVEGEDYVLSYAKVNSTEAASDALPTEAGSYKVTATAKDGGAYIGEAEVGYYSLYAAPAGIGEGREYRIASKADSGYILDVEYATPVEGSNVSVWTSNGGDNQLFTFEVSDDGYYVLRNVANPALVLDAAGAEPGQGSNVSTWESNGGPNQKWVIAPSADAPGYFSIASAADSSLVLDAAGAEPSIGANVGLWEFNGGNNQLWRIVGANDLEFAEVAATHTVRFAAGEELRPDISVTLNGRELAEGEDYCVTFDGAAAAPSAEGEYEVEVHGMNGCSGSHHACTLQILRAYGGALPSGPVHIVSAFSDQFVLDVEYATPVLGSNVSIWEDNGGDNQLFTLELQSDGCYVLRNVANAELVLDAAGAEPDLGANVSTWSYNGGPNQKWVLAESAVMPGCFTIHSAANPEFVLDAAGAEPSIGANVSVWTANGGPNQLWKLAVKESVADEQS